MGNEERKDSSLRPHWSLRRPDVCLWCRATWGVCSRLVTTRIRSFLLCINILVLLCYHGHCVYASHFTCTLHSLGVNKRNDLISNRILRDFFFLRRSFTSYFYSRTSIRLRDICTQPLNRAQQGGRCERWQVMGRCFLVFAKWDLLHQLSREFSDV